MNIEICKKCILETNKIHPDKDEGIAGCSANDMFFVLKTDKTSKNKHHAVSSLCRMDCIFPNRTVCFHGNDISKIELADRNCRYWFEHQMYDWSKSK